MMINDKLHYDKYPQQIGLMNRKQDDYVPIDANKVKTHLLSNILGPIDLEDLFRRSPGARIVNNETMTSMDLSKEFCDAIYNRNDGDIGFTASCECGKIYGRSYEGMLCPECRTEVTTAFVDKLTHTAWVGTPPELPPFVHPVWYFILKTWTGIAKGGASVIDLLLDPDKEIPDHLKGVIEEQSFDYFHKNHERIFDYLFNACPMTAASRRSMEWVKLFYEQYKDILFTTKLPILHSSLHPLIKSSGSLKLADKSSKDILEAIFNLSTVSFSVKNTITTKKHTHKTLYSVYSKLIVYYQTLIKEKVGAKVAIMRQHNLKKKKTGLS